MSTRVRSYSKINLGLRIGPPRPDGFHSLSTLYQTLALHDFVTVTASPAPETTITLESNHPGVPTDSSNTAWKIVEKALTSLKMCAKVHIRIQKDLPVQGGMGAGSANAAAALIGLEKELNKELISKERMAIAAEVGSDVPLFLVGGTSLGEDRGQIATPYPDLPPTPCVIAVPSVGVSTPAAFREWDRRIAEQQASGPGKPGQSALTGGVEIDRIKELSRVYASISHEIRPSMTGTSGIPPQGDLARDLLPALVRTGILTNDFQEVAFVQHPSLRDILHALLGKDQVSADQQAITAMLSGSGSSLYGLYRNEDEANAAAQRVQQQGTRAIVTKTLPRSQYWSNMFAGPEQA